MTTPPRPRPARCPRWFRRWRTRSPTGSTSPRGWRRTRARSRWRRPPTARASPSWSSATPPRCSGRRQCVDRLAANASGPEYSDARELRTYGSADEARATIDEMVDAVEACPTQDLTTTTWVNTITERIAGRGLLHRHHDVPGERRADPRRDLAARRTRRQRDLRVDPAPARPSRVLTSTGSSGRTPTSSRPSSTSFACQFSERSCTSEGTGTRPDLGRLPARCRLADDRPEGDPAGAWKVPVATSELLAYPPCGVELPKLDRHRLTASEWSNVEDNRSRELVTFADADAAVAYLAAGREFFAVVSPGGDRQPGLPVLLEGDRDRGGRRVLRDRASRPAEFDGSRPSAWQVLHFIRVGHSVLIDTSRQRRWGRPRSGADRARQIDEQTADAAAVVAAMCVFTEAGC